MVNIYGIEWHGKEIYEDEVYEYDDYINKEIFFLNGEEMNNLY